MTRFFTIRHHLSITALIFLATVLPVFFCPGEVEAQDRCVPIGRPVPITSTLASAGFFTNLRNSTESLRYQMDEMLTLANSKLKATSLSHPACVGSCPRSRLGILFNSTPNVARTDYSDHGHCERLLAETTARPIVYRDRSFESVDEAKEWYQDLTQGDGTDGEDLYNRCDRSCSPSYSSVILPHGGRFVITTTIICGHARDKDDDQYRLSSALQWECLRDHVLDGAPPISSK